MVPHLGHWLRVALATFLSCITVYEIFTDGLGETSSWFHDDNDQAGGGGERAGRRTKTPPIGEIRAGTFKTC